MNDNLWEAWKKIKYAIEELGKYFFPFTSGNISVKIEKLVYCTPTSVRKENLNENLISVVDLENNLIRGPKQTSEINLHLEIYKSFEKLNAVIHTHPFFCTIFAITHKKILLNLLPEYYLKLKKIVYVKYLTPGTIDLAKEVVKKVKKELKDPIEGVVLLRNHGLVTFSNSIEKCVELTFYTEELAKINYYSQIFSKPKSIPLKALKKLLESR